MKQKVFYSKHKLISWVILSCFVIIFAVVGIHALLENHATPAGYQTGFVSSNGHLYWAGSNGTQDFGVNVYPGTHPSTALVLGIPAMVFEGTDSSLWGAGEGGVISMHAAMAPGTSPSIAPLYNPITHGYSYEVAYQGANGDLWVTGITGGNKDTGQPMWPGTNPAITGLTNGKYEIAFSHAGTHSLYTYGWARTGDENDPMIPGTSPSITKLAKNSFEMAYMVYPQGNVDTVGEYCGGKGYASANCLYNGNWWAPPFVNNQVIWPYGSPSISSIGTDGKHWVVSYEGIDHNLWTIVPDEYYNLHGRFQAFGSITNTGIAMDASSNLNDGPSITGLTTGGYEIAAQTNSHTLVTLGTAGTTYWGLSMFPGSSPSIVDPPTTFSPAQVISKLSAGQNLYPGQYISSPNGLYSFTLQPDSNMVVYDQNGQPVWNSNTTGKSIDYLTMQNDGNLVAYGPNNQEIWSTGTANLGSKYLTLDDSGVLLLETSANEVIWTSTNGITPIPSSISAGTNLFPGQYLLSPSHTYQLYLQTDGNLVERNSAGTRVWASGTNTLNIKYLSLQGDGNLVLRDIYGSAKWSPSLQGLGGTRLNINDDGHIVVYSDTSLIVWYNTINDFSGAGVTSQFPSTLSINHSLYPEHQLVSPTRKYRLIVQSDGNLAIYSRTNNIIPVWQTNTAGSAPGALTLQSWSDLTYYSGNNLIYDAGITGMGGDVTYLLDSGNLAVYTGSGYTVWSLYGGQAYFPSSLSMGQYLYPGQQMLSPKHSARLVLQNDGNLVVYNWQNSNIWSTATNGQCPSNFTLQSDSNLVLRRCDGVADWTPSTQGTGGVTLLLGEDGNIWINDSSNYIVWSLYGGFVYFPNVLFSGQYLYPGQHLLSTGHHFRLLLQTDGNLVIYNQTNIATWSTGKNGVPVGFLTMQGDGNLVQRDAFGNTLWSSNTQNLNCNRAYIDDRGDIEIWTLGDRERWTLSSGRLF